MERVSRGRPPTAASPTTGPAARSTSLVLPRTTAFFTGRIPDRAGAESGPGPAIFWLPRLRARHRPGHTRDDLAGAPRHSAAATTDGALLMHQVSGRVVAVSIRAALIAGGWIGFGLGLVSGCVLGAILSWFSGAIFGWQRDLTFTVGVTEQLLPFGNQIPVLQRLQADWFLVIPVVGLLVGG